MKGPNTGVTRRGVALAFVASAAAVAQQPSTPEDLNALAREQAKQHSNTLRSFEVPIATEPSFAFRP